MLFIVRHPTASATPNRQQLSQLTSMPKQKRKCLSYYDKLLQDAENASDFSQLTYLLQFVTTLNVDNPQSGFHEYLLDT
jgi:hypothetical protein